MRRSLPILLAILALVVGWPGAPSTSAVAQDAPQFVWDRYDVEITLRPDGTFGVVETQVLDVTGALTQGQAFRTIPLDRLEELTDISVEEPGRPYSRGGSGVYTYAATREDGVARIQWRFPPVSRDTRTFVLRYRVAGAIRVYEGGDQLDWIAVWADRPAPVRRSTVTLRFPSDVAADAVQVAAFPERADAEARLSDPRTAVVTATDLSARLPLEIRAQFPHGLVAARAPSWQADADLADWWNTAARPVLNFLALLLTLGIAAVGAVFLGGLWYARGRDPAVGAVPSTLSEPPSTLPPGVVGTLVDERADVQDVVATLVDLANRGIVRITPEQNPELVGSSLDYRLELLESNPPGLRAYEQTVLRSLFRDDVQKIQLSDLKDRFVASIPVFQEQLHAEVQRDGLFHQDPERVRRRYRSIGTTLIVVGLIGGLGALLFLSGSVDLAVVPFVVLAVLGVVARWLATAMPQRTRVGALEAARWKAFANFLRAGRGAEDPSAASAHGERWLPYAVALGVDQTWVRNLASVGSAAPRWYASRSGSGGYRRGDGSGPIVILPGGGWGGGGWGGSSSGSGFPGSGGPTAPRGPAGVASPSGPGGLQDWSDGLADMLNRTSDVLSRGGGSGWSGGGFGGGGGSGGGSGGFS